MERGEGVFTLATLPVGPRRFRIEFDYNSVIAFGGSSARLTVPEIDAGINLLTGILNGLPDYLVRKHFERKHGKRAYYGQ